MSAPITTASPPSKQTDDQPAQTNESIPSVVVKPQIEFPKIRPRVLAIIVLVSFLLVLLIATWLRHEGPVWAQDFDRTIEAKSLQLTLGEGAFDADTNSPAFVFTTAKNKQRLVAASARVSSLKASQIATIRLSFEGEIPDDGVAVGWVTSEGRQFIADYATKAHRTAPLQTKELEGWRGDIIAVSALAQGDIKTPIRIQSIELRGARISDSFFAMLSEWASFEPWDGSSINFLKGGSKEPKTSLALVLAATVLLSFIGFKAAQRGWHLPGTVIPVWIWPVTFFAAWIIMDFRWQANLLTQLNFTRDLFAGKSNEEKHNVDTRGLAEFMEKAKVMIAADPSITGAMGVKAVDPKIATQPPSPKVYIFSDSEFSRVKGAYFMLPLNVFANPKDPNFDHPNVYRPGDFFVLYRKSGARYIPAEKTLVYNGDKRLRMEPLTLADGNGVFRVIP